MFIANLSIKRPVFITVIIIALLTVGIVCYSGLPINQYPDTDVPYVMINITERGASPDQIESKVTKRVEDAVGEISGVKHITSTINDGVSMTNIEFDMDVSTDKALQDVKDKIDGIKGTLPRDIDDPVISKLDMSAQAIISLVVTGPMSNKDLSAVVNDTITKRLNTIKGIGSITTYGTRDREIHILLDKQKLLQYNITPAQVTACFNNDNVDASSGKITGDNRVISLRTNSSIKNANDFLNILIANKNGVEIRVRDVATLEDGLTDRSSLSYYDGKEAIGIYIVKQSGSNTVQVADDIKNEVSSIQKLMPKGVNIVIINDNSIDIRNTVTDVEKTIIEGCILAVLIIFLFLKEPSSTGISAISLPVSIITTFIFLKLLGFSLNMMSLMGLSLSVGLLVDDAIVVIENVSRHMSMGKTALQAAKDGTSEIGLAVMATSLAVVAVFLPVSMVSGMIGKFFKQFGLTVAASVMVSLFTSFTLVPMLASKFLKHDKKEIPIIGKFLNWFNAQFDKLTTLYGKVLKAALRHRVLTVIIPMFLFVGSILLATQLGMSFISSSDDGKISIQASFDAGATLNKASDITKRMEGVVKKYKGIEYVYSTVSSDKSTITVQLIDKKERKDSTKKIATEMHGDLVKIPGIQLSVNTNTGMGSSKAIQYHIQGQDFNALYNYALKAEKALGSINGSTDVSLSYKSGNPETKIDVDRDKAADLGVDANTVANTLSTLFNGTTVSKYETSKDRYDVKVMLQNDQRKDFDSLDGIYVANNKGNLIPLDQVTKKVFTTSSATIDRYDKYDEIQLSANIADGASQNVNMEFNQLIRGKLAPPNGVTISAGGNASNMTDGFKSLGIALFMGILFIFLVLAAQFESFIDPLAVLFSLPLAIIGAILGLFVGHKELSLMAFIGIIMLMGLLPKMQYCLLTLQSKKENLVWKDQKQ